MPSSRISLGQAGRQARPRQQEVLQVAAVAPVEVATGRCISAMTRVVTGPTVRGTAVLDELAGPPVTTSVLPATA